MNSTQAQQWPTVRLRCFLVSSTTQPNSYSRSSTLLSGSREKGAITLLLPNMQRRGAIKEGGGSGFRKGHFRASSLNAAIALLFDPQLLGLNKQSPSSGVCLFESRRQPPARRWAGVFWVLCGANISFCRAEAQALTDELPRWESRMSDSRRDPVTSYISNSESYKDYSPTEGSQFIPKLAASLFGVPMPRLCSSFSVTESTFPLKYMRPVFV